jgi:hypothetical protein
MLLVQAAFMVWGAEGREAYVRSPTLDVNISFRRKECKQKPLPR